MGIYINPKEMTKEEWLEQNGVLIPENAIRDTDEKTFKKIWPVLPVCLVDNGPFTAAGIGFSFQETRRWFYENDFRPKLIFFVNFERLKKFLLEEQIEHIENYFLGKN